MADESVNEGLGRGRSDVPASEFTGESLVARQPAAQAAEADALELAKEVSERKGYSRPADESRRSTADIEVEVRSWTPEPDSRDVLAGLTSDEEPLDEDDVPLVLTDEDRELAARRIKTLEAKEASTPKPLHPAEAQLLQERWDLATEDGLDADDDNVLGAALDFARRNPSAFAAELARLHEDERQERIEDLPFTGSDEEFESNYADFVEGETEAQVLAKKVDAILVSQERVRLAAEHALLSRQIEERENTIRGEKILAELGHNIGPGKDVGKVVMERWGGVAGAAKLIDSLGDRAVDFLGGDTELVFQLKSGLTAPVESDEYTEAIRGLHEVDRQLRRANEQTRFAQQFTGESTNVADGLREGSKSAQERLAERRLQEREQDTVIRPKLVRAAMEGGALDRRDEVTKLREQSPEEIKASFTAPDERSWKNGLRDSKGRFITVEDAKAQAQGFKNAKAKVEHERREREARAFGVAGHPGR